MHAGWQVAGEIAGELGIRDKIFWATKVNAAGREGLSGAKADPVKAGAQMALPLVYLAPADFASSASFLSRSA